MSNDELGQRLLAAGFPPADGLCSEWNGQSRRISRDTVTGVRWFYDRDAKGSVPMLSDPATQGYVLWWLGQQYGETLELTRRHDGWCVRESATGQPALGVGETEADALVAAAEELVKLKFQKERIRVLREQIHYGTHVRVRAHGPDPIDVRGLVIYTATDRMVISNLDVTQSIHFNDVTDFAILGQLEPK